MMLLNMSMIHWRTMCDVNRVISLFFFEEPTGAGDNFLAMIENSNLHHVSARTLFQSGGAPPHFSCCVHSFPDRKSPDCYI